MRDKREFLASTLERLRAFDVILRTRRRSNMQVLSALSYHNIGDPSADYMFDPDTVDVTPEEFRWQLSLIERHFTVVGIDEVCHAMDGGKLPPNPLLITFDDGYLSCRDVALPILKEFGVPATFFIATDYVTNRRMYWWDTIHYMVKRSKRTRATLTYPRTIELDLNNRKAVTELLLRLVKDEFDLSLDKLLDSLKRALNVRWTELIEAELADQLIMSWDDVRDLRDAGMDVESHTRRHRVLQTLSAEDLDDELRGSREDLERELGESVRTVAYPVGYSIRHNPAIYDAVRRAGYKCGFTNISGINYMWRDLDPLDINRVAMERGVSRAMFLGRLAIPAIAHPRKRAA